MLEKQLKWCSPRGTTVTHLLTFNLIMVLAVLLLMGNNNKASA